ncbi:Bacterial regulatory s, crp family protein [[Clostridium] ultunense Esp]|nr:Bacterial regulatory s, crp family protein [[Clostridium] ultunense Esp]
MMIEKDDSDRLKKIEWFQTLSDEEIGKFAEVSQRRHYPAHTHLFYEGDPLDRIFFLLSGKVRIYRIGEDGREQMVNLMEEGDLFPHIGFFKRGNYPANAETTEEAEAMVLFIADFEEVLLRHPSITIRLFRELSDRLMDLHQRLEEKLLHDTQEQIYLLLLRMAKNYGDPLPDGRRKIRNRFTHKELANMIGTSRETMNRSLNQLKQEGLLSYSQDGRMIIDMERLIHIL